MEACWCVWVCVSVCAGLPLLYLLWKRHPCYGAHPGAPVIPLLGCLPCIFLNKHRFYEWTCDLFDRSASLTLHIVVCRTIFLCTADPQVVHHILKSHFPLYPKGPSFYPFFADLLGSGIFNCDGPLWHFQRKVASREFTSNSLKDFVIEVADTEIHTRLLPSLDSACLAPGRSVDIQALLMHYTFDTICQLTFGADPACLDISKALKSDVHGMMSITKHVATDVIHDDGHATIHGAHNTMPNDAPDPTSKMKVPKDLIKDFVQGFQTALQIIAERFLIPQFIWQTKRLLKIGSEKRLLDALEAVNKFTSFVIEQSKREVGGGGGKERKDLLARFMRLSKPQVDGLLEGQDEAVWKAHSDEHGHALSDSFLKGILLSFILAGRETVASGATFLIWLLSIHPRVEKAVLQEIQGILKNRESHQGHSPDGCIGTTKVGEALKFSYDELRKMNYLQAALSESMRLYPPVPSDCKYAAEDDTLPDGTQVLKGYQVTYNVFAMGRAERVWGKDCLEFRPERWLGEDGQFVAASPYKYPVFQAGPRICLGKDFAFIQMKLLVASIVRDFEIAVQPGFKPKLSYGVSMLMVNGLPVTLKKRRPESLC